MQILIIPAILAVLWFLNLFPCPGFVYVLLGAGYLFTGVLEKRLIDMSAVNRDRHIAIMERIENLEYQIENKVDNLAYEVEEIKRIAQRFE
ncbi:hypothetical protein GQH18_002245 [Salmonella enterica]|nr:hypothetical protein [Salmonella enterica]